MKKQVVALSRHAVPPCGVFFCARSDEGRCLPGTGVVVPWKPPSASGSPRDEVAVDFKILLLDLLRATDLRNHQRAQVDDVE